MTYYQVTKESLDQLVERYAQVDYKAFQNVRFMLLMFPWALGISCLGHAIFGQSLPYWQSLIIFSVSSMAFLVYLYLGRKYPYESFLTIRRNEFNEILHSAETRFEIDSMIHDVDCLPPSGKE